MINNLAASMLWHRVTVLNPPKEMLTTIQKAFVDFFWNGHHWLIPGILYLPVAEGGQGLIHIESKILAMRLQTLQRLLYCSAHLRWVPFGLSILTDLGGIGLDKQLFLMEKPFEEKAICLFPNFYMSVIKSWKYLSFSRTEDLHYGVSEPLFFNPFMKLPSNLTCFIPHFLNAGVSKIMDLIDLTQGQWRTVQSIAAQVKLKSLRTVDRVIQCIKDAFPPALMSFINSVLENGFTPQDFPELKVTFKYGGDVDIINQNTLLKGYGDLVFHNVVKKTLYYICVKSVHVGQLQGRTDTKWRAKISICEGVCPSWRVLYKPPVSKRCGDLQWRVLHGAIASNSLVSKFTETVLLCPFCNAHDTVYHMFFECSRLAPLFEILEKLIIKLGFSYNNILFILGYRYRRSWQQQCVLANFLIGQAKLAILKSHQCKNAGKTVDMVAMFKSLVESRVMIEYTYYQYTDNVAFFEWRWCVREALVFVSEYENLVFNW